MENFYGVPARDSPWSAFIAKFERQASRSEWSDKRKQDRLYDCLTHGKTYNKSPRRINHKETKSKTDTGTTALERSVDVGFKALLQLANFTLGPDATLNTETHKNSVRIKAPNSVNASKRKHKVGWFTSPLDAYVKT